MDKNSVIGLVLIAAIFIGFSAYESNRSRKNMEYQAQLDSIARANAPVIEDLPVIPTEEDGSAARSFFKDSVLQAAYVAESELVTLENDKLKIQFTTKGAQPYTVQVKDYYNYDSTDLYIFRPQESEYSVSVYAGQYINTKDFTFELSALTDSSVVMRLPFSGGGYIEQKYVLSQGSYLVDNQLSFVGMESVIPRNVNLIDIDYHMSIPRMEKGYKNEMQYSNLYYYFDGDKKPEEVGGRGRGGSKRVDSRFNWVAFQQQFFSAIFRAPGQIASSELTQEFYPENDSERRLMACSAKMRVDLPQGSNVSIPFQMYFGPNHYQVLKSLDQGYEKIIPLGGSLVGWFTKFVIIPLFNFLHKFIDNFGLIILLMTLIIKIVVFPLTYKSYASSAKISALKPEIDKINAKYPNSDNQQEMLKKQQATMNLYKRAGASPMSGCIPTLLTFPILWAMFRFFPASIELRQQPFLWCDDLSTYDSFLDYGMRIPILGDHLSLFALLMAVTMWLYSKMTMSSQPAANDPSAASMKFMSLWMMPIMMFFICNSLPAALSYYYLLSQLISIVSTIAIRKSINPEKILAKVRASEGKPMPKSKWQQRLEEAQKMQEQQLRQQQRRR